MYSTADCLWQADFQKQKSEKRVTSLLIITLCINPDDRTKHLPHNIKSIIYNSTQKRTHLYNHLKSIPYSNINKLVINTKIKFGLCNIIYLIHTSLVLILEQWQYFDTILNHGFHNQNVFTHLLWLIDWKLMFIATSAH